MSHLDIGQGNFTNFRCLNCMVLCRMFRRFAHTNLVHLVFWIPTQSGAMVPIKMELLEDEFFLILVWFSMISRWHFCWRRSPWVHPLPHWYLQNRLPRRKQRKRWTICFIKCQAGITNIPPNTGKRTANRLRITLGEGCLLVSYYDSPVILIIDRSNSRQIM